MMIGAILVGTILVGTIMIGVMFSGCSELQYRTLGTNYLHLDSQVDAALSALHLPATSRAQELTLQHFVDLHVLLHDSKAAALMEAARSGEEAEEREEAKEGEGGEDSDV